MRFLDVSKILIDEAFDARRIFNAERICADDVVDSVLPMDDKVKILFDDNELQSLPKKWGVLAELLDCILPQYMAIVGDCDFECEVVSLVSDLSTCECSAECVVEYRDLARIKFLESAGEYLHSKNDDKQRSLVVTCFLGAIYYSLCYERLGFAIMHIVNFVRESMLYRGKTGMSDFASTFVMDVIEKHAKERLIIDA